MKFNIIYVVTWIRPHFPYSVVTSLKENSFPTHPYIFNIQNSVWYVVHIQ